MKRPLFWAAAMFALGEVLILYMDAVTKICMLAGMLIFCVLLQKDKSYKNSGIILLLSLAMGCLNGCRAEIKPQIYEYFTSQSDMYSAEGTYEGAFKIDSYRNYISRKLFLEAEGRIVKLTQKDEGMTLVLEVENSKYGEYISKERYRLIIFGAANGYRLGNRVIIRGKAGVLEKASNPGGFNALNYYRARGIYISCYEPEIEIINDSVDRLGDWLWQLGRSCKEKLYRITDEKTASVINGMLLGESGLIDEEAKKLFQINGIAHILAISGVHISIIGGALFKLLRRLKLSYMFSGSLSIAAIILYGIMTGSSLSTTRAVIMLSIYIIGQIFGKNYDLQNGMAAAFLAMLLVNPCRIYDGGFVLSYLAVLGVALGGRILKHIYPKKKRKHGLKNVIISKLLGGIIISVCINLVTLPAIISMYYVIPLYAFFINLIVIPLMSLLLGFALAALLVSFFSIETAVWIIKPSWLILKLYTFICEQTMRLPLSRINTGHISAGIAVTYYVMLAWLALLLLYKYKYTPVRRLRWLTQKRLKQLKTAAAAITLVIGGAVAFIQYKNLYKEQIVFLDVGQGDGTLIRNAGAHIVIDGGSSDNSSCGEYVLCPALRYMRMSQIDYYCISHCDTDHVSGLIYILENYETEGIVINNLVMSCYYVEDENSIKILKLAGKHGINVIYMKENQYITDGSYRLECVFPTAENMPVDINGASLILSYSSDLARVLFTGDTGSAEESAFLERAGSNYDILKVAHHGSKNSVNEELYSGLGAKIGIISCGKNNSYGHPHKETLDSLAVCSYSIFRTDYQGAVIIGK